MRAKASCTEAPSSLSSTVRAAASPGMFRAYLDRVLLPALRRSKPDAVLVMDNLPAHSRGT